MTDLQGLVDQGGAQHALHGAHEPAFVAVDVGLHGGAAEAALEGVVATGAGPGSAAAGRRRRCNRTPRWAWSAARLPGFKAACRRGTRWRWPSWKCRSRWRRKSCQQAAAGGKQAGKAEGAVMALRTRGRDCRRGAEASVSQLGMSHLAAVAPGMGRALPRPALKRVDEGGRFGVTQLLRDGFDRQGGVGQQVPGRRNAWANRSRKFVPSSLSWRRSVRSDRSSDLATSSAAG